MRKVKTVTEDIDVKLMQLSKLQIAALRAEWVKVFRTEVPATMSATLLRLAIGYKLQEQDLTRQRPRSQPPAAFRVATMNTQPAIQALVTPGAKLLREYNGQMHEVIVLEGGHFAYDGKICHSLSDVARRITGKARSGPRFFGLCPKYWKTPLT